MKSNLDKLLEELREIVRDIGDDPGLNRIRTVLHEELPGLRRRAFQEQKLGRVLAHFRERDFGIVSAFRKEYDEDANLDRQWQLAQDVRKLGHGYIPIVGRWEGVSERSLFIPNITKDEVMSLGRKYQQDAVIWGSKGKAEVIDAKTGEPIISFERLRVLDVDTSFDDYSALRVVRGKPVRPFRLEPAERREYVNITMESLKPGDIVYAELVDTLPMRSAVWPSTPIFRYVGSTEDTFDGKRKSRFAPVGAEPPPKSESDVLYREAFRNAHLVVLEPRLLERLVRVGGSSLGVS